MLRASFLTWSLLILFCSPVRGQGKFYHYEDLNDVTSVSAGGAGLWHNNTYYYFYTRDGSPKHEAILNAYNISGDVIWSKSIQIGTNPHARKMLASNDGQLLIAGQTTYQNEESPYVIKLDNDGGVIWSRVYPAPGGQVVDDLLQLSDGKIVVIGTNNQWEFPSSPKGTFAIFCQVDGQLNTYKFIPTLRNFSRLESAVIMDNGDILACGSYGHNWDFISGLAVRFRPNGDVVWKQHYRVDLAQGYYNLRNPSTRTSLYFHDILSLGQDRYMMTASYSDHDQYGTNFGFHRPTLVVIDGDGQLLSQFYFPIKMRAWKLKWTNRNTLFLTGFYEPGREGCLIEMKPDGTMLSRTKWWHPDSEVSITWDINHLPNQEIFLQAGAYDNGNWQNVFLHDDDKLSHYCYRQDEPIVDPVIVSPTARDWNDGNSSFNYFDNTVASTSCICHEWNWWCSPDESGLFKEPDPCSGNGINVELDHLGSSDCINYQLDFDDGTVVSPVAGANTHVFQSAGTFNVKLKANQPNCPETTINEQTIMVSGGDSLSSADENLFIPNIITPNNDGLNDAFKIELDTRVDNFIVSIYNRHSQCVFQSFDQAFTWGGQGKSSQLPAGVYYVILEYDNPCTGKHRKYTGTLTMVW